jgi:hypothetical protein
MIHCVHFSFRRTETPTFSPVTYSAYPPLTFVPLIKDSSNLLCNWHVDYGHTIIHQGIIWFRCTDQHPVAGRVVLFQHNQTHPEPKTDPTAAGGPAGITVPFCSSKIGVVPCSSVVDESPVQNSAPPRHGVMDVVDVRTGRGDLSR